MASYLLQNPIFSILKAEQSEGVLEQATERTVGPESENVEGKLKKKKSVMRRFMICVSHQTLLGNKSRKRNGRGM